MSSISNKLYFLPHGVGYQDPRINVRDTEISDTIQEADLYNDQEFSACAVHTDLQSYFDFYYLN